MKSRFTIILPLCLLSLVSACSTDSQETIIVNEPIKTLYATSEIGTKTQLFDRTHVLWSPGDKVKVFYKDSEAIFVNNNTEPASNASFDGYIQCSLDENDILENHLWGLYPYQKDALFERGSIITSLPSEQTAIPNTFANNLFISVGHTTDSKILFYHVCGGICFTVMQQGIKSIVISGNSNENLAGRFRMSFGEDDRPRVDEICEGCSSITLRPNEGPFIPGISYYAIVLPTNLQNGMTFTYSSESEEHKLSINSCLSIKRATISRVIIGDVEDYLINQYEFGKYGNNESVFDPDTYQFGFSYEDVATYSISNDGKDYIKIVFGKNPKVGTTNDAIIYSSDTNEPVSKQINVCRKEDNRIWLADKDNKTGYIMYWEEYKEIESISLDISELSFYVGDNHQFTCNITPSDASNPKIIWSSSDESIVSISEDGIAYGVKEGLCTITATALDGGMNASCRVTVNGEPTPEALDLGLSVKWASFNIGARQPTDFGNYYAWGEIETKTRYWYDNYKWKVNGEYIKYCYDSSGIIDRKYTLDPEDDVAHISYGGKWRMPTYDEAIELRAECSYSVTKVNGVKGVQLTGPNGKSIFFPCSGYFTSQLWDGNKTGRYWTASLYKPKNLAGSSLMAYSIWFIDPGWRPQIHDYDRCYGYTIRAVCAY